MTDLVFCSHSREEKSPSNSQINKVILRVKATLTRKVITSLTIDNLGLSISDMGSTQSTCQVIRAEIKTVTDKILVVDTISCTYHGGKDISYIFIILLLNHFSWYVLKLG